MNTTTAARMTAAVRASIAAEQAGPTVTAGQWVTITRPSTIDGRPHTRPVHLERRWVNGSDPEDRFGQAWVVTNHPGHSYEMPVVLTAAERATARSDRA